MKTLNVQSLPLHKPIILKKDKSLRQAALAMNRNNVGSVIVSDGHGSLRGLFTDRDLALALALKNMRASVPLSDITEHPLIYVNETASLETVVALMKKHSIRRIPVVHLRHNGRQTCLGIITLDDLIKEGLIDKKDEIQILRSQLRSSKEKYTGSKIKSIFHTQGQREHSMFSFLKIISDSTNLSREKSQKLMRQTLTLILRRVPQKSGSNLLSQLPYELQMLLLNEISPADRSVTAKSILEQTQKRLKVTPSQARALLQSFWRALAQTVSAGEIRKIERDLPREITELLSPNH